MTPATKFNFPRTPKRYLLWAAIFLLALSFVSAAYFTNTPPANLEQKNLERYLHRQQQTFGKILADTQLVRRLAQQKESLKDLERLRKYPFGIYVYAENQMGPYLLFWNNHDVLPAAPTIMGREGTSLQLLANGYYVVEKKRIHLSGMTNAVQVYALIPIYYQYKVKSDYLSSHFAHSATAHEKIVVSPEPTPYVVKGRDGKPLLYLKRKSYATETTGDAVTFYLRIGALALLLVYLHLLAESVVRKRRAPAGILLLAGLLLALRLVIIAVPGIFNFDQYDLFSPEVYASSWLNPSLGDLILNAILFCWIVIFAWQHTGTIRQLPPYLRGWRTYVAGAVALFVLIIATFLVADLVRSLVADSQISFQVTDFFSLTGYTTMGFVVLALLCLGYYYFSRLLFRFIFPAFANRSYLIYFSIAFVGLLFLSLPTSYNEVRFYLPVLLWLIVYTLIFSQQEWFINHFKVTLAGVLFWIFVFSASMAGVILKENKEKQWLQMQVLADRQDQRTDPSQEKNLSIALTYLDESFFKRNFDRFKTYRSNRILRDSIATDNFHQTYREAYSTQIYAFDSSKLGLFNDDSKTYDEIDNIFTVRSRKSEIPGLSYYEPDFDQIIYLAKREVRDSGQLLGTFFILSVPKRYYSDNFLPELLSSKNKQQIENSPTYSYAVYDKERLKQASNLYPFKTSLASSDKPQETFEYRQNGSYNELWYKASTTKTVVIAKKRDTWLETITLFSYLFCSFLLMVALLHLAALLLRTLYGWKLVSAFSELSIRSQVHGTIIFISLLSFLIIGVATITFFIERSLRNNIDRTNRASSVIWREIEKRLKDVGPLDSILRTNDSVGTARIRQTIEDMAQVHAIDVNLYDIQGNLRFSSIDVMYNQGLVSPQMHPAAYYHLSRMREMQYQQQERISKLEYLSQYTAIRNSKSGLVQAYLNMPYFTSQHDLQQEISNFLVTIINLNAFIFLIAGVIALFIANRITRSFSVIGEKMKAITLGKTNEEIEWNRKDEIGELVVQYNKMVHQLEASAEALARSEREGAWREMARQVAHEIKNPLTPMKLSIQYLQKAINDGHPNVQELTTRVANTLVEQIDHLSKIAADFSRFANIGNPHVERFDLHSVLEGLSHLYLSNPKVQLQWNPLPDPVWLDADKTHINRLFTNLLSNAVEACNGKDECLIKIEEGYENGSVQVRIIDNGEGIPAEMQQKIFVPNFTTKSSGTGLGLAMCKGIVEQAGGRIWFETAEGVGTTFFVELPIAEE